MKARSTPETAEPALGGASMTEIDWCSREKAIVWNQSKAKQMDSEERTYLGLSKVSVHRFLYQGKA